MRERGVSVCLVFFYFKHFKLLNFSWVSAPRQSVELMQKHCKLYIFISISFHRALSLSPSRFTNDVITSIFNSSMDPLQGNYLDRKWKHTPECIGNLKTQDERKWRAKKQHTISWCRKNVQRSEKLSFFSGVETTHSCSHIIPHNFSIALLPRALKTDAFCYT